MSKFSTIATNHLLDNCDLVYFILQNFSLKMTFFFGASVNRQLIIFVFNKKRSKKYRDRPNISPAYVAAQITNFAKLESGMPQGQLHERTCTGPKAMSAAAHLMQTFFPFADLHKINNQTPLYLSHLGIL